MFFCMFASQPSYFWTSHGILSDKFGENIPYWTQIGEISRWLVWVINSGFMVEQIVKSSLNFYKIQCMIPQGVIQGRFQAVSDIGQQDSDA